MKYYSPICAENLDGLALADGSIWDIIAADDRAKGVVSVLIKAMQLESVDINVKNRHSRFKPRRLIVYVGDSNNDSAKLKTTAHLTFENQDIICTLISGKNDEMSVEQLMHLAMVICRDTQSRGGILLHGALAEWKGNGVILAGPGGRGKTTTSKRLPNHWQSLCDDTTLVVCDNKGEYYAHPWPTWSTFMFNGPGGTWDVQHAVPLIGIFFLEQAHKNAVNPLGIAQSICLINESAEQASWFMPGHSEKDTLRKLRLQRFDNICALAKAVPSYVLRICANGTFWQEIERALNG